MSETNEETLEQMSQEEAGGALDNLVTIATFPDPATASVARTALEGAGILAFLHGENANTLIPVAFVARLQVRAEDEAAARAVLSDAELSPESLESVTAAEEAGEGSIR